MSNVFEAIVCKIDFYITKNLLVKISSLLDLEVVKINEALSVVYRVEENRHKLIFEQRIEYLASQLSLEISWGILLQYKAQLEGAVEQWLV